MRQTRPLVYGMILFLGFLLAVASPVAHAYNALEYPAGDTAWKVGMLVSLGSTGETAASSTKNDNYIGIVTATNDASVEVATNGTVQVLVTDEGGPVAVGADLYVSHIAGIASATGGAVVGTVTEVPTAWSAAPLQSNASDSIRVGMAQVRLLDQSSGASSSSNSFLATLQKTGNGVAGHTVDLWRVVTALIIGLGGLILSFGLLFISSRESFFSIGRNPMGSAVIMQGLWKVVVLSVIIMCVSLGAAYGMLRIG